MSYKAAEHGGLSTVRKALSALSGEIMIIIDEHKKDDKVDADGDGIADASQTTGKELIQRKVKLVLTKMNPEKVNDAIASIYKGMCHVGSGMVIWYIVEHQLCFTPRISFSIPIYVHSMDDRIGSLNYSICSDHCYGIDNQ